MSELQIPTTDALLEKRLRRGLKATKQYPLEHQKRYATFILELTDDTPLDTIATGMEQSVKVAKAIGMADFTTPAAVADREWETVIEMTARRVPVEPTIVEE